MLLRSSWSSRCGTRCVSITPAWRRRSTRLVHARSPGRDAARYETWLAEPGSFILIAEQAGTPVGYAMVRLRSASPTWSSSERAGEIETLSVLPETRGQGVGTALLDAVRERLKPLGLGELSLHVIAGNDDATRFYERHGFSPFATWMRAG